ncbi:transglycosylase, partial [Streptococcus pneumoniae]
YWTWSYGQGNASAEQPAQAEQQTQQTQPQQTEQASTEQPAQQAAPQTEQTQQPKQETTEQASTTSNESSSSEASEGSSVNVNSHLQAIAQRESGGDLKAVNPSSGAAGKYQFLQSTWDSVAPSQYKGVSPTEAPESVQDAAAVKLYNEVGPSQWVTA